MKFYELHIAPNEYEGEGEDLNEWFTSLSEATARRKELIALNSTDLRYGRDYAIDQVTITDDLPTKQLVLAILNRKDFVAERKTVVVAIRAITGEA